MADAISLTSEEITAKTIQEIKDVLYGGITYRNMKTFRTFFVVNTQDSFDADYPVYVPFNIPGETAEVVSVRVSFWLLPFRAYSKSASGGSGTTISQQSTITTPSGGGTTTPSGGGTTTPSGGGKTSSAGSEQTTVVASIVLVDEGTFYGISKDEVYTTRKVATYDHTHSCPNHQHTCLDHIHTCPNHQHDITHTHTTPAHNHDIDFGIYEEDNSPSVTLYVSRDGGATYPTIIGTYSTDQTGIEITQYVDTAGSKMLKFEASALGRLSVQVEIKLDMSR